MEIGTAADGQIELLCERRVTLDIRRTMIGMIHLDATPAGIMKVSDKSLFLFRLTDA